MTRPVRVNFDGRAYEAEWQVVDDRVEIWSEFGTHSAALGPLRSAPATAARELLQEVVKRGARASRAPDGERGRYDVREVFAPRRR